MQPTKRTFTITLPETGELTFAWGIWAMKLFCDRRGIGIDDFFPVLQTLSGGNGGNDGYKAAVDFLSAGFEAHNDRKPTEKEVCGWLDQLGGITQMHTTVNEYINWVISLTLTNETPLPGDDKKKEEQEAD